MKFIRTFTTESNRCEFFIKFPIPSKEIPTKILGFTVIQPYFIPNPNNDIQKIKVLCKYLPHPLKATS